MKNILVIALAVVMLVGGGVAGYYILSDKSPEASADVPYEEQLPEERTAEDIQEAQKDTGLEKTEEADQKVCQSEYQRVDEESGVVICSHGAD